MAKITATFSIWSKMINTDQISTIISATPDKIVLRGPDREPPRPVPDAYGWHVVCRDEKELLAEITLLKLLHRVRGASDKINDLRTLDQKLDVRTSIGICPYQEDVSLLFSTSTIKILSEMGSALDIEFFPE